MTEPEPAQPPPPNQAAEPKKKKRRIEFKTKMALLDIIERKRLSNRVDYKAIGTRHGVSWMYLKHLWRDYLEGEIELGDPETPEERQINVRVQHERQIGLLHRYKALVLNSFEGALATAEDKITNANKKKGVDFKAIIEGCGLPPVLRQLRDVEALLAHAERGYNTILEDANNARREKSATPALPAPPVTEMIATRIVHANDEETALEILKHGKSAG